MNISATTALALITRWMDKMLVGQLEAAVGGERIRRIAVRSLADSPEIMHGLSTLWEGLLEPMRFGKEAANRMVLLAAREWLALPHDDRGAMLAYLDRWIHDELGYGRERPVEAAGVNASRLTYTRQAKIKTSLTARLPKNGHDADGARELVALGYPTLAPVLPHLFKWLETSGSAVELVLRPFFAELGAPARDMACQALLHRNKPALKYCLLRYVLPGWPREVLITLPLESYLCDSDAYGLDVWALKLMVEKRIPTHEGLEGLVEWKRWKITRLEEQLGVLASLDLETEAAS